MLVSQESSGHIRKAHDILIVQHSLQCSYGRGARSIEPLVQVPKHLTCHKVFGHAVCARCVLFLHSMHSLERYTLCECIIDHRLFAIKC